MNAPPQLFDADLDALLAAKPRVRTTDGVTARSAAKKMESGNGPMMAAIRRATTGLRYPASAFQIAKWVRDLNPGPNGRPRWQEDSVRSAVSRAPFLRHKDNQGVVPDTGNACRRYVLKAGA